MLCLKHLKLAGPWYHYEMRRIGDKAKKGTQKNGAIVNIISEKLGDSIKIRQKGGYGQELKDFLGLDTAQH